MEITLSLLSYEIELSFGERCIIWSTPNLQALEVGTCDIPCFNLGSWWINHSDNILKVSLIFKNQLKIDLHPAFYIGRNQKA